MLAVGFLLGPSGGLPLFLVNTEQFSNRWHTTT
jgi:hypothetical protein